jgi:hypothetical protein
MLLPSDLMAAWIWTDGIKLITILDIRSVCSMKVNNFVTDTTQKILLSVAADGSTRKAQVREWVSEWVST